MALELTTATLAASRKTGIEPQLVLEIDGVSTRYGAIPIQVAIRVGDDNLLIGNSWIIGSYALLDDQADYITMDGTSTKINQQLQPDRGAVSSVSSLQVSLIDKNEEITQLISPGIITDELLFKRAKVYFGFHNTSFPEDYIPIFAGFIDEIDSGPGNIKLNISHPDQKKRQEIFTKIATTLDSAIDNSQTTIPLTSTDNLLTEYTATPTGSYDPSIKFYVRIDDEVIRYTGITGNTLTGCTRGAFNTAANAHDDEKEVSSIYVLEGNCIDLALKVMLSGTNGYYREGVEVEAFNQITATDNIPNAIYLRYVRAYEDYGLLPGDYITTTGATNGANNVTLKVISSIVENNIGSYLIIDGVTFSDETMSPATISFRSKYDTLGHGLAMTPEDVDTLEHERWRELYLTQFDYRLYLKDTVNGKELIEKEIYLPCGAYAIPRKTRSSMGFHIGPVPSVDLGTLDRTSLRSPSKVRLKRTTNRYFTNTITYAFEEDILEDKFLRGLIRRDEDSINRIDTGTKETLISSKGIRDDLDGFGVADQAAIRRLGRYRFAAEYFEKLQMMFGAGFSVEIGDLLLFDFEGLYVSNTQSGNRNRPAKFYEVINRSLDLKTGNVEIDLVDTNYDENQRFGLHSPSSIVASGGSMTYLIIQDSFGMVYPGNEKKKWEKFIGLPVLVHSEDFSFQEEVTLLGFDPINPYQMNISPLSMASVAGWIVDIVLYDTTDPEENSLYKATFGHMSPTVAVTAGVSITVFTVGAGDTPKFFVGSVVQVSSQDFSVMSPEVNVISIVGNDIEVDADLGFTPSIGQRVDFIGFADHGSAYRYV